uniref:G_PROTEIN_RECEP_F1_2 domain-containing protein n=1 Tax=Heterorhabditis bacteriophora TaxID=37862 RepID=A0A1I7WWE9_HETBA
MKFGDYILADEELQMNLQSAYFALYIIVPLAGIALNFYVLWRLLRIARKSVIRFETTSGLPLSAMSISDSITLLAQLIDIYLMHTTSAFSVWCWLALSVLRYTAVFHPIKYRTIWRQPRNALKVLACSCCIFEMWILFFVVYSEDGKICSEDATISVQQVKVNGSPNGYYLILRSAIIAPNLL